MKTPTIRRVVVAIILGAALFASVTPQATATANVDRDTVSLERDHSLVRDLEPLRLACRPAVVEGDRGVLCRWSQAENPSTRAYQLYKITNGEPRELVTTVAADGRRGFFDTEVSAPSELIYGVVARNRIGRVIGISRPAFVQLG